MINQISKVLFVGLGGVGQRHLRNLIRIKGDSVQILAYRKRNAQFVLNDKLEIQEGEELNAKFHIECVNSLEEGLKKGIDAVFICNPTSLHIDVLEKSLRAGCDVFIEKPIADDLHLLELMEKRICVSGSLVFVGYQNRYHPCIVKLKQFIDEHKIGKIVSVHAEVGENVKNWHKYENYKEMYACKKELGGGVIVTQIHELDYLYYIFGMPKSVYALGGKLSDLEIDVEDVVDILMKYEINCTDVPVVVHEDYLQSPTRRGCRIIGTKGKIEIDLIASTFVLYDENGNISYNEKFEFDRNDMFMTEMNEFITCIEQGKPSPVSLEEGKKSLKIAMAVKESIRTGNPVELL